MNQNTEYENFTQEIYQKLINDEDINTIDVKHNVKLLGKSGQRHQIDVYWEYEFAGIIQKVVIECKNYIRKVSVDKVNAFCTVISDLSDVKGIMVTKVGYQSGAKKIATHYGITLKELRTPNEEDSKVGQIDIHTVMNIRRRLFLLDKDWMDANNINLSFYRMYLDNISLTKKNEWAKADYLPLETSMDTNIFNERGEVIAFFDILEQNLSPKVGHTYDFENAYVDTRYWGRVKIKAIKYVFNETRETKVIAIDASNIIKAILKDTLSGKIKFFDKNGNIK